MNIQTIKDKIECMTPNYHIEIARILINDNKIDYDENQNGIFINLTQLSPSVLQHIEKFIDYVTVQESYINVDETQKNGLKDIYFKRE
jgi:hypothetical protein